MKGLWPPGSPLRTLFLISNYNFQHDLLLPPAAGIPLLAQLSLDLHPSKKFPESNTAKPSPFCASGNCSLPNLLEIPRQRPFLSLNHCLKA